MEFIILLALVFLVLVLFYTSTSREDKKEASVVTDQEASTILKEEAPPVVAPQPAPVVEEPAASVVEEPAAPVKKTRAPRKTTAKPAATKAAVKAK
jgi:hypothetical protein